MGAAPAAGSLQPQTCFLLLPPEVSPVPPPLISALGLSACISLPVTTPPPFAFIKGYGFLGTVWLHFPSLPPPYPPRSPQGSPAADAFLPQPPGALRCLPWHGGGGWIWGSRPSWAPRRAAARAKTKGGRLRFPTKPRLMLADTVPMATAFNTPAAASSPFQLLLCASVRRSGAGNLPERVKGSWRGLRREEGNGGGGS